MAGILARMVERYPGWENFHTLWYSARAVLLAVDLLTCSAHKRDPNLRQTAICASQRFL